MSTVEPLSSATGVAIQVYDPRSLEDLVKNLMSLDKGSHVVVSGHSNSTPSLANMILGNQEYAAYDESVYSNLLVITITENPPVAEMKQY